MSLCAVRRWSFEAQTKPILGSSRRQPAGAVEAVADPVAAAALPCGRALESLFPDALTRRAAAHIRLNPTDPVAGLPEDDHELVSFITGLLTARRVIALHAGPG